MPFNPRVVHGDNDGELPDSLFDSAAMEEGLPPELADLGAKLQADAAWLGSVYPAPHRSVADFAPTQAIPLRPVFAHLTRFVWSGVAVALLAIAIGGPAWLSQQAERRVPSTPELATHPPANGDPSFSEASHPVLLPANPDLLPAARYLWHDATGPELEGLLDLMEDDSLADSVVSL